MGDIADDHYNQMVDRGFWFRPSVYGPPISCNRCGDKGVFWTKVKGQHKLYDKSTNEQHVCPTSADGFEDVL